MPSISIDKPSRSRAFMARFEESERVKNKYTEAALERHKREGLGLAVKARWATMALISVLLAVLNPHPEVLYYHAILAFLATNGWFIQRAGRVGRSRTELFLILVDLVVMTIGMVVPNPFSDSEMPLAMQYRLDNFMYFFVILAAGTMAYSWRTVIAIGLWTGAIWMAALGLAWWAVPAIPGLSEAAATAFADYPRIARLLDPNDFQIGLRVQEITVFLIVAVTLAISVRRFNGLLMNNAGLERERANLSRYFSPNVVDELSQNDDPLKQVRSHDIAVLFIDIMDFTRFSDCRDPFEVIELLRGFHARMEAKVFEYGGTLDKYLGDGLMATFGTPIAGKTDATDALRCARAMNDELDAWNIERVQKGREPINAGIGIHFGRAVLGDIGANRLEFAVIGTSVNIASRLETLTRSLGARLVMSDNLRARVIAEGGHRDGLLDGFECLSDQEIRGIAQTMTIWTLR